MALKTAPVLPQIEDSSFDHLAFYNYIMNEADIGLNPNAAKKALTTLSQESEFSIADPSAPCGTASLSGASLAAALEMGKTYRVLTDNEYRETANTKTLLSTKLANLEVELERTIARKVELSTVMSATTINSAASKDTHQNRRSLFSNKRKSKVLANSTVPGAGNSSSSSIDSPEIAVVNEKIVTLNQQITELSREIKEHEVQLLQHQAGVLAANEQSHQDVLRRQQTPTAKATARMKGFSMQQQQQQLTNNPQEAHDMSVIDGLIISLSDCLKQISVSPRALDCVTAGADGKRLSPSSHTITPNGKSPESSQTSSDRPINASTFNTTTNTATSTTFLPTTTATITGQFSSLDSVASKLQTLAAVSQQLTAQVRSLQAHAAATETALTEATHALDAAAQARMQLQRDHLHEIKQLKRNQVAEIEQLQVNLATLEATTATPLSVNILQREFKNIMREKFGS
jgi:hypothetical protein